MCPNVTLSNKKFKKEMNWTTPIYFFFNRSRCFECVYSIWGSSLWEQVSKACTLMKLPSDFPWMNISPFAINLLLFLSSHPKT